MDDGYHEFPVLFSHYALGFYTTTYHADAFALLSNTLVFTITFVVFDRIKILSQNKPSLSEFVRTIIDGLGFLKLPV